MESTIKNKEDSLNEILTKKNFKTIDEANLYLLDAGYSIEEVIGITNELFNTNQFEITKSDIARKKLEIIIKRYNDGWEPDLNDSSQYKYSPLFKMEDGVFSCYDTRNSNTDTSVPSALLLKSEKLATLVGKEHINLYKEMMRNE